MEFSSPNVHGKTLMKLVNRAQFLPVHVVFLCHFYYRINMAFQSSSELGVSFVFLKKFIQSVPSDYTTEDVVEKIIVPATVQNKVPSAVIVFDHIAVLLHQDRQSVLCLQTNVLRKSSMAL